MNRTISVQELKTLLETGKDVTLLDVRRKADYDAKTIPNAAWRDPENTDAWSGDLPQDGEVVIYCARGGSVSNAVLDRLLEKKIRARFIEGGIAAWKESGGRTAEKKP
jgi:rhodanese-related sulfurtransferase